MDKSVRGMRGTYDQSAEIVPDGILFFFYNIT